MKQTEEVKAILKEIDWRIKCLTSDLSKPIKQELKDLRSFITKKK